MNRLKRLRLDLARHALARAARDRRLRAAGPRLRGQQATSNPTVFAKAITGSDRSLDDAGAEEPSAQPLELMPGGVVSRAGSRASWSSGEVAPPVT
jgi:hypothetical protein